MHSSGIGVCRSCESTLPRTPLSQPYQGMRFIAYMLAPFEYTGAVKKAIIDFKFNNLRAYAEILAYMSREYINSYNLPKHFDVIIPVPLYKDRLRDRGYNQAELLGEYISEYTKIPMNTELLKRVRPTKKQSLLTAREKIENVKGAFEVTGIVTNKRILLLDDIYTTGSTLNSCAEPLVRAGAAKVCAMTIATSVRKEMPVITY